MSGRVKDRTRALTLLVVFAVAVGASACARGGQPPAPPLPVVPNAGTTAEELSLPYSPEVLLGDRLFFETRFAQFFFEHSGGDINATLPEGDPVVQRVPMTTGGALPGPFRGQAMNCRHCHLGDDFLPDRPLKGRTYCDFTRKSAIPDRGDGQVETARNSPLMIDLSLPREVPLLLHLDGEFVSAEDLVIATLTGRNLGWLPHETATASAHVAKVIREDDGLNPRHLSYPDGRGIPYRVALRGTDPDVPRTLRIPPRYRLDVETASDDEILWAVASLMRAYMEPLQFGTEDTNRVTGSPYDLFLEKNDLPLYPQSGESALAYAERLVTTIGQREHLMWVTADDEEFELHEQPYRFGAIELEGLKVFFARADPTRRAHVGNCVICHTPPRFTDFRPHNNGVAQTEYDAVFGLGAFAALAIPGLAERNAAFDAYLPPSSRHPDATGRFRAAPAADEPGRTDLGTWNIFANPDVPKPQAALTQIFCEQFERTLTSCTPEAILPLTIASFKTPSIRDLGQSDPYLHSGSLSTIEEVLRFYVRTSDLARAGTLRNGAPELSGIHIDATDIAQLDAFLQSLNEDYH